MMNTNETGRSMVEMLGVLAIIGVLSVGGIAGYNMAMTRYRANEIVNTATMLAMTAKSANGGSGAKIDSLEAVGLKEPYSGITMTTNGAECNDTSCTIKVSGASGDVMKAASTIAGGAGYTLTS